MLCPSRLKVNGVPCPILSHFVPRNRGCHGTSRSITGRGIELKNGTPGAIRTRDLLLRRQTLYPTELRVPMHISYNITAHCRIVNLKCSAKSGKSQIADKGGAADAARAYVRAQAPDRCFRRSRSAAATDCSSTQSPPQPPA